MTVDREAAASVEGALTEWAAARPQDLEASTGADPLPAVAVPAAFLAVQEYGQRLSYALDGFELQEEAESREAWWNWTGGLVLEGVSYLPVKPVALVADVVGAYAPVLLDLDGTFEQAPDRGLRHGAGVAGANALATLPPDLAARADAVRAQSEAAYRRAAAGSGHRRRRRRPRRTGSVPPSTWPAAGSPTARPTSWSTARDARGRATRWAVSSPGGAEEAASHSNW